MTTINIPSSSSLIHHPRNAETHSSHYSLPDMRLTLTTLPSGSATNCCIIIYMSVQTV